MDSGGRIIIVFSCLPTQELKILQIHGHRVGQEYTQWVSKRQKWHAYGMRFVEKKGNKIRMGEKLEER